MWQNVDQILYFYDAKQANEYNAFETLSLFVEIKQV